MFEQHISKTVKHALTLVKGENALEIQINIANKIVRFLKEELQNQEFDDDLIEIEGKILKAVFSKVDAHFSDLNLHLKWEKCVDSNLVLLLNRQPL